MLAIAALSLCALVHPIDPDCGWSSAQACGATHAEVAGAAVQLASFSPAAAAHDDPTIAGIVSVNENYETLLAAVKAAGLVDTLNGEGPFTVFAPTDAAFGKLDQVALRNTINNKDRLTQILTYHVVPGRITAADLASRRSLTTVNGQRLVVNTKDRLGLNDGIRIIAADIEASNGIIHAIDQVLVPAKQPIAQVADNGGFKTLVAALGAAGLADTFMSNDNTFTVFAPTDEAFAKLGDEAINALVQPANRDLLTKILQYHVIADRQYASTLTAGIVPPTLAGEDLRIRVNDGGVLVNRSRVINADIDATNGVIHAIDTVLIPPSIADELSDRLSGQPSTGFAAGDAIATAIAVGAPLFNDGNIAACRAVYESTARNLLAFDAYELRNSERRALRTALDHLGRDNEEAAWTLRRAFDSIIEGRQRSARRSDH